MVDAIGLDTRIRNQIYRIISFHEPPVETIYQLIKIVEEEKIAGLGAVGSGKFLGHINKWRKEHTSECLSQNKYGVWRKDDD